MLMDKFDSLSSHGDSDTLVKRGYASVPASLFELHLSSSSQTSSDMLINKTLSFSKPNDKTQIDGDQLVGHKSLPPLIQSAVRWESRSAPILTLQRILLSWSPYHLWPTHCHYWAHLSGAQNNPLSWLHGQTLLIRRLCKPMDINWSLLLPLLSLTRSLCLWCCRQDYLNKWPFWMHIRGPWCKDLWPHHHKLEKVWDWSNSRSMCLFL